MKKIQNRTLLCIILCFAFVIGLIYFIYTYSVNLDNWTTEKYYAAIGYKPLTNDDIIAGNTQSIYMNTSSTKEKYYVRGSIVDKSGKMLAKVNEKGVTYSEDAATRMAMLHTIGDRNKNISTGAIRTLSDYFSRYVTQDKEYTATDDGNTIKLTMDAEVQKKALNALGKYVGTVGIYNYKTGEIICMVSTPTFDPDNVPEDILTNTKYSGAYINRFLSSAFTPGSTMKTITLEAAIDNIPDLFSRKFTCRGKYKIGYQIVNCTGYHGTQDIKTAYANSCNCAFAQLSEMLRQEDLQHVVNSGGLTKSYVIDNNIRTGAGSFELVGDNAFQFAWSAIGLHRDLNNPCAMMIYLGAIANHGKSAIPTMISEVTDKDGNVIKSLETKYTEQLINEKTADTMRAMMINNTVNHSGHYYTWRFNVRFGAKTGTVDRAQGGMNGWFSGFVDNEKYPYAFICYVENGGYGVSIPGGIIAKLLNDICK
ncbi:MAG: penicillin-binding transpeptidase domain-containing protein [Clostridiales bacterium]|nr:penicillin-binding transpeptidase domain-containing protein [Clostridiales bacterium]